VATSNAAAERRLRLLAEELIAGAPAMAPDEALAGLADVEACASAMAGAGVVDGAMAMALVVAVVDALAVRRVAWLEPVAADLDLARLHEAVGSSRPELRTVVPVAASLGAAGVVTCVASWDDRTEARVVGVDGRPAPTIVLDAVGPSDRRLDVRDGGGSVLGVELDRGARGSVAEVTTTPLDVDGYLAALEASVHGEARRGAHDVDHLNAMRRRLLVSVDALGVGTDAVDRFDALVATLLPTQAEPRLVDVVPLALRVADRWLLAVERWDDHWRLAFAGAAGRGRWTATDADGRVYGGGPLDADVIRFDPSLAADWTSLRVTWIADGTNVAESVEVRR
jgi:hypothetical protein